MSNRLHPSVLGAAVGATLGIAGIVLALAGMIMFLFQVELTVKDPEATGMSIDDSVVEGPESRVCEAHNPTPCDLEPCKCPPVVDHDNTIVAGRGAPGCPHVYRPDCYGPNVYSPEGYLIAGRDSRGCEGVPLREGSGD